MEDGMAAFQIGGSVLAVTEYGESAVPSRLPQRNAIDLAAWMADGNGVHH